MTARSHYAGLPKCLASLEFDGGHSVTVAAGGV